MKTFSLLFGLSFGAGYASAHGFLSSITINGKAYTGNNPYRNNGPAVIRTISTPDPNYGASNPALTCGPNATAASQVADVNPGDKLTFDWRGADMSHWPHNTGPMLTYLASCGSNTCDQFDATQAKWFKIHQVSRKDGKAAWEQQDIFDGGVATVTLPNNLAPGNYLIRHEIIALHLATQRGMAEFYPACSQLRVLGSQTGKPTDSELVSLPGAYSDDDPGIYDRDVYNPAVDYPFPGPPIAAFVSASDPSSTSTRTRQIPTPSKSGTSPTQATIPPKSSGKVCRLKKRRSLGSLSVVRRVHTGLLRRLVLPWSN